MPPSYNRPSNRPLQLSAGGGRPQLNAGVGRSRDSEMTRRVQETTLQPSGPSVSEMTEQEAGFWAWFREEAYHLTELYQETPPAIEDLCELVDRSVRRFTGLDFEVGPEPGGGNFFAFAPTDGIELEESLELASRAPADIPGWRVLPSRPARPVPKIQYKGREFEVSGWSYVIFSFTEDPIFEIDVYPGEEHLSDDAAEGAAWLAVILSIGDLAAVRLINKVAVVGGTNANASPLRHLRDHLLEVIPATHQAILNFSDSPHG